MGLRNFSLAKKKKKGLHNFISKPNRESLTVIIWDLGKACFGKKNIKNLIFFYTKDTIKSKGMRNNDKIKTLINFWCK